jgi:hypothetical protein
MADTQSINVIQKKYLHPSIPGCNAWIDDMTRGAIKPPALRKVLPNHFRSE